MSLLIELTPQEEEWLREQAVRRGEQPEQIAAAVLRAHIRDEQAGSGANLQPVLDAEGRFHPERWQRIIAAVRENAPPMPSLPREALTREGIY